MQDVISPGSFPSFLPPFVILYVGFFFPCWLYVLLCISHDRSVQIPWKL